MTGAASRAPRRRNLGLAFLMAAFGLFFSHQWMFFTHDLALTVTKNDAAEYCRTGRRFSAGGAFRSSVPERPYSGYCGAIETDLGHYVLPDDKYLVTLHQSRQDLDRTLVEGCRFRVRIVGYGGVFQPGDKPRYPIVQTISRVLEPLGCTAGS